MLTRFRLALSGSLIGGLQGRSSLQRVPARFNEGEADRGKHARGHMGLIYSGAELGGSGPVFELVK